MREKTTTRAPRWEPRTPEIVGDGTVRIPVGDGLFTIVDQDDFPSVAHLRWNRYSSKRGRTHYAKSSFWNPETKRTGYIALHRLIMNAEPRQIVDHINGDGLDNRRSNLRFASNRVNAINRPLQRNNTTGFRGVSKRRGMHEWKASIKCDGATVYLGEFDNPLDAARAYDRAAIKYFGEFAKLNFPEGDDVESELDRAKALIQAQAKEIASLEAALAVMSVNEGGARV